jgi:predicted Fe-Mo cluster-binding NifX family protein
MRLLVPTIEPPSPTARVSSHFGRAPFFAVLDTDTGEVTSLGGPSAHHECGMLAAAGEIDTCHDQGHGRGEGHSHHS